MHFPCQGISANLYLACLVSYKQTLSKICRILFKSLGFIDISDWKFLPAVLTKRFPRTDETQS